MMENDKATDPVYQALKKSTLKLKASDLERTQLAPDAPAPRFRSLLSDYGQKPLAEALSAWEERLKGTPIVEVAQRMNLSIEGAKHLIGQAHAAIAEDLKENLELNRALDLARVDGLLQSFYPQAKAGDEKAALVTLKCLATRAKLTGLEPQTAPAFHHPENVLIWVQQQLPSINKLVDQLPLER